MHVSDLRGAIFDVDDTLLDNHPNGSPFGLHERSRLLAAHEVGRRHNKAKLLAFTPQQSQLAFRNATEHSLRGAVWEMLRMAGEVAGDGIEPDHPLLQEMMQLKEKLHETVLRTEGQEVAGAGAFVANLARHGLDSTLAIASTACRRDIDIFLDMSGLNAYFPAGRIISRDDFVHPKPHPEPYNMAFTALGLPESARPFVAAFEDDPRGIMSAKAAGLVVYAITTRYSREELAGQPVAPDMIASSFAELAADLGVQL